MRTLTGHLAAIACAISTLAPGQAETTASSGLAPALAEFASYEFGQDKEILHQARMAAYRNSGDESVRRSHEQVLIDFVQSDARLDARREACLWLAHLGSTASEPVLKRLHKQEGFADVAQIALDAVTGKVSAKPGIATALGAFEAEVLASQEPLTLLKAAWQGSDDARSRHAFELLRRGKGGQAAAAWIAEHHAKLSAQRQRIAMQLLLELGVPEAVGMIVTLSRTAEGELRSAAVRNLGFLKRSEDVPFLMNLHRGNDEALAQSARRALHTLPTALIQDALLSELKSADAGHQAKAIALSSRAPTRPTAEALLAIAGQKDNPNRIEAARLLGKAAPPGMFEDMIGRFVQSIGTDLETPYKQALWDLARKQPDHQATRRLLQTQAAKLDNNSASSVLKGLGSRLDRLSSPKR